MTLCKCNRTRLGYEWEQFHDGRVTHAKKVCKVPSFHRTPTSIYNSGRHRERRTSDTVLAVFLLISGLLLAAALGFAGGVLYERRAFDVALQETYR